MIMIMYLSFYQGLIYYDDYLDRLSMLKHNIYAEE